MNSILFHSSSGMLRREPSSKVRLVAPIRFVFPFASCFSFRTKISCPSSQIVGQPIYIHEALHFIYCLLSNVVVVCQDRYCLMTCPYLMMISANFSSPFGAVWMGSSFSYALGCQQRPRTPMPAEATAQIHLQGSSLHPSWRDTGNCRISEASYLHQPCLP